MKTILFTLFITLFFFAADAQIPSATNIQILKAEDSRNYDKALESLLNSNKENIRIRAALAAGRIGDEAAVEPLIKLVNASEPLKVREMAVFALGEIESIKAASAILELLNNPDLKDAVRARAVEAAGKIAAANSKDSSAKQLGEAVLNTLRSEELRDDKQDKLTVLLGLTAALRTRPEGADVVVAKFLTNAEPRIRSDAANTLSRLRAKNANAALREMLLTDKDAIARANAASALGSAKDTGSIDLLLNAAAEDKDLRVRVSAIRSLGNLKDKKAVEKLLVYGDLLLKQRGKSKYLKPIENSELLEIAATLGKLLPGTENEKAIKFLNALLTVDELLSAETEIAFAQVAPKTYLNSDLLVKLFIYTDPWAASAYGQGLAAIASTNDKDLMAKAGEKLVTFIASMGKKVAPKNQSKMLQAMPDLMRSIAALKPSNLDSILRLQLENSDVFVRAAAAELIAELPYSDVNMEAVKKASFKAFISDKKYDDALLAAMDAAFKMDKKKSVGILLNALNSPDYLVRKKAFELLKEVDTKESPGVPTMIEDAKEKGKNKVLPYTDLFGTKLGQVLNTDADYRRAAGRKNSNVKAVITTAKGTFTIDLLPEDAPLTVDNFITLANAKYFNGLSVHRVVPNFVMQDGDPRGDGNGGPGWSIRCEINMVPYERGAIGMALSGKDTGGSQWFATHAPQPHLDGGYTVFGTINEAGMKVVDKIIRGDKILTVKIIGSNSQRPKRKR